jgi:RNA polymerase sigma factor (sigma-70 family)
MKLSAYVNKNYIKLSSEDIKKLFQNKEANKDLIIKSQLALILKLADSYSTTTRLDIEELFSMGLFASNKAINGFTPEKNVPFLAFNKICIKNYLNEQITNTTRKTSVDYITDSFTQLDNNNSFEYDEGESYITKFLVADYVDEEEYNPRKTIEIIYKHTKPKEGDIIIKYLGLVEDSLTFNEIGDKLNMSGEGVRLYYIKCIRKLKDKITL